MEKKPKNRTIVLMGLTALLVFGAAGLLGAQEGPDAAGASGEMPDAAALNEEAPGGSVVIDGSFETSVGMFWAWDYTPRDLADPTEVRLEAALDATFFVSAPLGERFGLTGRVGISYPDGALDPDPEDITAILSESFTVYELYGEAFLTDFVTLKAGKRFIPWEMGYFFSPADFINLDPLDPEDPDDYREGPLALTADFTLWDQHLLVHLFPVDQIRPWEIATALQFRMNLDLVEARVGARYRYGDPPAASAGISLDLGVFSPFLEGSASIGSLKTYAAETTDPAAWPAGVETRDYTTGFFWSVTLGSTFEIDSMGISGAFQYLFNAQGYGIGDYRSFLTNRNAEILLAQGTLTREDLFLGGSHYGAARVDWTILDTGLTVGVYWIGNMAALSGQLEPSVTWRLFDLLELRLAIPLVYHDWVTEFGTGLHNGFAVRAGIALAKDSFRKP
jgi:hypothetical protein